MNMNDRYKVGDHVLITRKWIRDYERTRGQTSCVKDGDIVVITEVDERRAHWDGVTTCWSGTFSEGCASALNLGQVLDA